MTLRVNPSKDTEAHARAFLLEPDSAVENKLVESIQADLMQAGYKRLPSAWIEWECAEHGLIHMFHGDHGCIEFKPGGFIQEVGPV